MRPTEFIQRMDDIIQAIRATLNQGRNHEDTCDIIAIEFELFVTTNPYSFPQWLSRIVQGEIDDMVANETKDMEMN